MNNAKFPAAVIFIKTFFALRNVTYSISTVAIKAILIISGIQNIWRLLEILLDLVDKLANANLPVPIFRDIKKIDLTGVMRFKDTILINKIAKYAVERGMNACLRLNVKTFPTVHIIERLLKNSQLNLEEFFSNKVLSENLYKIISFKISLDKINSCGLKDQELVFFLQYLIYHSFLNAPNPIIIPNKILQRRVPYSEKELQEKKDRERTALKDKIERENLEVRRRNYLFIIYSKIYFMYLRTLKMREKLNTFSTTL
jgi:hypothetical protein